MGELRIEKRDYLKNPWRLVDSEGREVRRQVMFPRLGEDRITQIAITAQPIMGQTRAACVEAALDLLGQLLRERGHA